MLEKPIQLPGKRQAPQGADLGDFCVYQPLHENYCIVVQLKWPVFITEFDDFESALLFAKARAVVEGAKIWVPCDWETCWTFYTAEQLEVGSLASVLKSMHESTEIHSKPV